MRVISQCGKFDCDYEHIAIGIIPENLTISTDRRKIIAYPVPQMMEDDFYLMGVYANEEKAKRAMQMLHNAYVGIIKGLNVDISADTPEKIQEMMKTGYGMLIAKESYRGDRIEFYPMNTVFQFPADEELEV